MGGAELGSEIFDAMRASWRLAVKVAAFARRTWGDALSSSE